MTGYIVLRKLAAADTIEWREVGPPVESVSAEAAIRKAVTDQSGTYVAVPIRSFKPVKVMIETPAPVVKLYETGDIPA